MDLTATLSGLLSQIASGSDVAEILQAVLDAAIRVTGQPDVALYLLNEEKGVLEDFWDRSPAVERTGIFRIAIRDRFDRTRAVLQGGGSLGSEHSGLDALCNVVRLVIDREEHRSREEALIQIGSALDGAIGEDDLIDRVIRVAGQVLRFQSCSIFLLDPRSDRFELRGTTGGLRDLVGKISYGRGEGFTGWVCDSGQPILLTDPQEDPRWRGKYIEIPSAEVASFLAVPIVGRKGGLGAVRLLRRKTGNAYLDNTFTVDDLRLMQAVADQIAACLENLRNMQRAIHSERMMAWGELSAKSSHMIGNRVFAIRGDVNELGHLIAEDRSDQKGLANIQNSLSRNVQRIEEILGEFRDFVSATQINRSSVDFNALVRETVEELVSGHRDVKLESSFGEVSSLQADGPKLRRAIGELIENAIHHTVAGRIRIATSSVGRDQLDLTRAGNISRFSMLTVEDTGPGVSSDDRERIFQPFFTTRPRGMGLGLSIVRGIVEAHGGQIFESGEGEGARFTMLLPLAEEPSELKGVPGDAS